MSTRTLLSTSGLGAWSGRIRDRLFPIAPGSTPIIEAMLLLFVGSVLAFFRLGVASVRGTLWAEDGHVLLQDAYRSGTWHSILKPYAGYLQLLPRLIAAFVTHLPLSWQGVAMGGSAAFVQAWCATLVYVALASQVRTRWARLLAFAGCVAVPVGPEVINSVANIGWFLLFASCVALFWTPGTPAGKFALHITLFFALTVSPFAFLPFGIAVFRWWACRGSTGDRFSAQLALAATAGFAVQCLATFRAPPRQASHAIHPALDVPTLGRAFLNRTLGDGVFGVAQHAPPTPAHFGALPGVMVLLLLAVLVGASAVGRRDGDRQDLLYPSVLAALCVITLALPLVLNSKTIPVSNPFTGGRYYVTPVMFLITCVSVLVTWPSSGRSWAPSARWVAATSSFILVAAAVFGIATSWRAAVSYGRETAPSWPQTVALAKQACSANPRPASYAIPEVPRGRGWALVLSCKTILDH